MAYFVYKRSDGYVGVVNSSEQLAPNEKPKRLRNRTIEDIHITFTVLLQTDDWDEAVLLLQHERGVIDVIVDTKPPADPDEVRRRTIDDIAVRLAAIERVLMQLDAEISECHGYASPAQLMVELAGDCVKKAMRANGKESK